MELHSYAKRRASKKWNIEQKRKLVEARISFDSWFSSKPSNSVVPWKKVLSVAKLDDFNVFFVRKQWSNMLTKYKQYKQTRLDGIGGSNKSIDSEIIERINQEWEFFEAIHTFMTRKTTNLHSYAVTQKFLNSTSSTNINTIITNNNNNINNNNNNNSGNDLNTNGDFGNMALDDEGGVGVDGLVPSLSRAIESSVSEKQIQMPKEAVVDATAVFMKLQHDCVKENIPNNTTILLQVAGTNPNVVENMPLLHHHYAHQHHRIQQHHMFSSDTNEEFEVICGAETDTNDIMMEGNHQSRNTDHDFYSKNTLVVGGSDTAAPVTGGGGGSVDGIGRRIVVRKFSVDERQLHYFADTSEESMGTEYVYQTSLGSPTNCSLPSVMENIELHTDDGRTFEIKTENISQFPGGISIARKRQESLSLTELIPSTQLSIEQNKSKSISNNNIQTQPQNPTNTLEAMPSSTAAAAAASGTNRMTERDKYYRHKRRFNRRLEKRFDAVLQVMGQVVKCEYPSVDIKPLMDSLNSAASGLSGILSSESDIEDDENDENDDDDGDGDGDGDEDADDKEAEDGNDDNDDVSGGDGESDEEFNNVTIKKHHKYNKK